MQQFCGQCGAGVAGYPTCPRCGAPVAGTGTPYPPMLGTPPRSTNGWALAAGLLGGALLVGVLGVGGFLLVANDGATSTVPTADAQPAPASTPSSPPASASPPAAGAPAPAPTADAAAASGDVLAQPAGLLCRDLMGRGFSYTAAVDYWNHHGQPDRMDADVNGIPCETVFPRRNISNYWQGRSIPTGSGFTAGLMCKDLIARGYDYPTAVAYWWVEGMPDRMDADLNGIPCETVYPAAAVSSFWF